MSGVVVKNSVAGNDGGGIASFAPLDVIKSTVVDNDAGTAGGGISTDRTASSRPVRNARASGIELVLCAIYGGGGSSETTEQRQPTVEDSSVSRNASARAAASTPTSRATRASSRLATCQITDTVDSNTAQSGGGGIGLGSASFTDENTFDLADSTVSRNRRRGRESRRIEEPPSDEELLRRARADEPAPGAQRHRRRDRVRRSAGQGKVSNSTVSGNSAAKGGGMHAGRGSVGGPAARW